VNFFVQGIETEYTFWHLESTKPPQSSSLIYYPESYKITGLEILVSYDVIRINRETYSLLQFMGDVGGLYDALFYLCLILLSNFNEVSLFSTMMPQLFVKDTKSEFKEKNVPPINPATTDQDHLAEQMKSVFGSLKQIVLPSEWNLLFFSKERRSFQKKLKIAQRKLSDELNLQKFIQR